MSCWILIGQIYIGVNSIYPFVTALHGQIFGCNADMKTEVQKVKSKTKNEYGDTFPELHNYDDDVLIKTCLDIDNMIDHETMWNPVNVEMIINPLLF